MLCTNSLARPSRYSSFDIFVLSTTVYPKSDFEEYPSLSVVDVFSAAVDIETVSYTHLTLPTILLV